MLFRRQSQSPIINNKMTVRDRDANIYAEFCSGSNNNWSSSFFFIECIWLYTLQDVFSVHFPFESTWQGTSYMFYFGLFSFKIKY